MTGNPVLELRHIDVRLGGRRRWLRPPVPSIHAVDDVSLEVKESEILGLVGESGCGKTTLGRTVLGLQRETAGEIRLNGRIVTGLGRREARRARGAIHYVHQDAAAALDPWWSVGHTMEEGLVIHGVRDKSVRRARIGEVLAAVGLDADAARRYPHELSGGQLRRIALARVLVLQPSIIILDEPTSGLDMSVQATILNLLLHLRERLSLTYIFISHDLSVVQRLCDRVAIMYFGRIVELASTAQVFAHPLHPYTRALLAAAPTLEPMPRTGPPIRGEPPSAATPVTGCPFEGRCRHAVPVCLEDRQALQATEEPLHLVACHRWKELVATSEGRSTHHATPSAAHAQ